MQKFILIFLSFIICAVFKTIDAWYVFTAIFLLMCAKVPQSSVWEIPIGVMSATVAVLFCRDYTYEVYRMLIPAAGVVSAIVNPKKSAIYFIAAALFLYIKNDIYGIYASFGAIWYGMRSIFNVQNKNILPQQDRNGK